jgi:hypothetical protein
MSEDTFEVPASVQPKAPRRRAKAEVETPEFIDRMIATDDKDDYEIIRLHASDDVPAQGMPFGVNGRVFLMAAEVWYRVPSWLLSSIDNIVETKPVKEGDIVKSYRSTKKYPYEIFRG